MIVHKLNHIESWRRSTRQAVSVSTDNNLRGQLPSISESSANIPGNAYLRRMMDAIAIDQPIGAVLTSITPPISNSPHVQVNADVHLAADGPQAVLGLGVGPSMAGSGPGNATQVDTFLLQEVPDENGQAAVNPSDATDPSMTPGQKRRVVQLPPTTEGGEPTLSLKDRSGSGFWKEQIVAFFQPSDNKLAMKLFGTRSALLKERRRQQQTGHWIIHPCSNFRWDSLHSQCLSCRSLIDCWRAGTTGTCSCWSCWSWTCSCCRWPSVRVPQSHTFLNTHTLSRFMCGYWCRWDMVDFHAHSFPQWRQLGRMDCVQ